MGAPPGPVLADQIMAGTFVILIFRCFVFENVFVEIFKESRGTVGRALLQDCVLADQIMAGAALHLFFDALVLNRRLLKFSKRVEVRWGGRRAKPRRFEASRADPIRAEPSQAEPSRAEPSRPSVSI